MAEGMGMTANAERVQKARVPAAEPGPDEPGEVTA